MRRRLRYDDGVVQAASSGHATFVMTNRMARQLRRQLSHAIDQGGAVVLVHQPSVAEGYVLFTVNETALDAPINARSAALLAEPGLHYVEDTGGFNVKRYITPSIGEKQ